MLTVAHNLSAMNARRQFNIVTRSRAKSSEKLSSGYKINRAADNAAGLAISEKLRYQIRGLNQGAENIQAGINLVQVADGALNEVDSMLHRMNELSVQAANGTLTDTDRGYIQEEVDAIIEEIDRIGAETSFNEIHIFDKETIEEQIGKITKLVESSSANDGKMTEAYLAPNGLYYPAASIDFSKITAGNVKQLDGGSFSFVCPYGCKETFEIHLTTGDAPSALRNNGNVHDYLINIGSATDGNDVVNAIYNYVSANLPSGVDTTLSAQVGGVGVSHASALARDGMKLTVLANTKFTTANQAIAYGKGLRNGNGTVDCSGLSQLMTPDPVFTIPIQCSSNVFDKEYVKTRLMNSEALDIKALDVSSIETAGIAIDKIKYAMGYIANMRSELGAQQNRLEHSYNTNLNTSENTQAAESRIRDTDMAKEMVKYSLQGILEQAGTSMMTQANQSNQIVLSLLS